MSLKIIVATIGLASVSFILTMKRSTKCSASCQLVELLQRLRLRRQLQIALRRIPRRLPVFSLTCCILSQSTEYEKPCVFHEMAARAPNALSSRAAYASLLLAKGDLNADGIVSVEEFCAALDNPFALYLHPFASGIFAVMNSSHGLEFCWSIAHHTHRRHDALL